MNTQNCEALEKLKQHSSIIAILEIASLLHDIGKCNNRFPKKQMQDEKEEYDHLSILEYDKKLIEGTKLGDLFFSYNFAEICKELPPVSGIVDKWALKSSSIESFVKKHEKTEEEKKAKKENPETILIALLRISDKKDASDDRNMPIAKQAKKTYYSTVFGKETEIADLDKLREEFYGKLSEAWLEYKNQHNTKRFRERVLFAFKKMGGVLAETRRAANDISLWHHSYATASIMKTLLSGDVLTDFSTKLESLLPTDNHWNVELKVIGIGWNANRFLAESQSLSGLIGRKRLIRRFKRRLKVLLEYEYSVGNVIYEDQDSLCFLVSDKIDETIRYCLTEKVIEAANHVTKGSIIPIVELSKADAYPNKIIPQVIRNLKKKTMVPIQDRILPQWTSCWDKNKVDGEVCAQCGRRPKSKGEELCEFCMEIIREGASNPIKKAIDSPSIYEETVWIDEIADENGNLALIFGSLPLLEWLDGTRLKTTRIKSIQDIKNHKAKELGYTLSDGAKVESYFGNYSGLLKATTKIDPSSLRNNKDTAKMLYPFLNFPPQRESLIDIYESICNKSDSKDPARILEVLMTKSASPSRLRKIWMETQAFFKDLSNKTAENARTRIGDYCLRLKLKLKPLSIDGVYLLKSENSGILEVEKFNPETKLPKSDLFWDGEYAYTTIRLEHYAPSSTTKKKPKEALLKEKHEYIKRVVEKLQASNEAFVTVKDKKNKREKISLAVESYSFEKYIPVRTILASPNLFVTLVPAELALRIVQKEYLPSYQECFGKVADRLPLNVGILFFKRKFPLYIAMDVMGRLVDHLLSLSSERRVFKVAERNASELVLEEYNGDKQQLLCTKDRWLAKYKWKIDNKLGDNGEDLYYPNFIVSTNNPDVQKKETYFELGNIGSILNIKDIEAGMSLQVYPGLFDFHFLGATGERFHLFSDNKKRRHPLLGAFGMRPYLLKDIEKMNELWNIISPEKGKLTTSQIKKLEYACITKIEDWFQTGQDLTTNPAADETYRELVDSSITNICKSRLSPDERNKLKEAVLSGMFFDVVELFLTLKSYNKEV
ncbi:CRISPR-associated protein Csx11 [Candidatus Bathyarchaeota archaeon A05DMB-2]|jgi:CRISPR-associated Csx11 family protein|nr:CRISPR-associated protein Csx11 [Candidatus Bathyarchaeota archaeon A05DMB-2]MBT0160441.1 CRISPR-associated protein Csx11 [Candidatus Bathyarchaeota archaeon A05DMB-2]